MTLALSELAKLAHQSFQTERWVRAENFLLQLLETQPAVPSYWFMLGVCRHRLNKLETALGAFEQLLRLDPHHRQGRFAAMTIANALGLFNRALSHCNILLEQTPDDPQALTSAGIVLEALERKAEALQHYDYALARDARWKDALINRGALLLELGDATTALANSQQFLAHYPRLHSAHLAVGKASMACGLYEAASASFQEALALLPSDGPTLLHAGFAQALREDFTTAQVLLDRAQQRAPEQVRQYYRSIYPTEWSSKADLDARSLYLLHHFERIEKCDWAARGRFLAVFSDLIENGPPLHDRALGFRALALGLAPALQKKLATHIAQGFSVSPGRQYARSGGSSKRPLRIGYVSPSFRLHAVGLAIQDIFKMHNRSRVSVYAYTIGPDANDLVYDEIRKNADAWCDLGKMDDDAAAQRIAEDEIDVLVDLAGYVDHCRPGIFALRPAHLQIGAIDYPATRGAPWIDYLLLDPTTTSPEVEVNCSEQIIRMPHTMLPCSYADVQLEPSPRSDLGLPDEALVLAAFHNPYKIDPSIFTVWMRLLSVRGKVYLWLLSGSAEMEANLKREARSHGIASERLIFAPRMEHRAHLARLAAADLVLDTVVCNGGVTVCDALVAGVPVLTCAGEGIAQRIAAGVLNAAGFPHGITASLHEYEARALEWLTQEKRLPVLRTMLLEARAVAPFYRQQNWVNDFEGALLQAHQRRIDGLGPIAFGVKPCAEC